MGQLKKKDKLFYARILPQVRIYEVCELIVRTIAPTWLVGVDKRDKHAYLFSYDDIGKILFHDREEALLKVINEEEKEPNIAFEISYEEY